MTETINMNRFSQRIYEDKFAIAPDGDDSRIIASSDDYEALSSFARELSKDPRHDFLGIKMMGPSGRIRTWFDGQETGYLEAGQPWDDFTTRWVKVTR